MLHFIVSNILPTLALVGPTSIGKTAVAVELVRLLNKRAEILSADSVQVYRRLDIGSAKPTRDEQSQAYFRLIDIVDPDQDFTLSDYQEHAITAYASTKSSEMPVILCGGTGLYIKSLTSPLGLPHVAPNEQFREHWKQFAEERGNHAVHSCLVTIDPDTAARLHTNDLKRIIRALEVFEYTGRTLSDWHKADQARGNALFNNVVFVGLTRDRAELNHAIDDRVDLMIAAGLIEEVTLLRESGFNPNLKSMQTLGYAQVNRYLDRKLSLIEAIDEIKLRTRQYARRQMIWFRADQRIHWITIDDMDVSNIAQRTLEHWTQSRRSE